MVVRHFDRLSRTGAWSRLYDEFDPPTYRLHVRRQRVLELLPGTLDDLHTATKAKLNGKRKSVEPIRVAIFEIE
jgi:hypothetical protein